MFICLLSVCMYHMSVCLFVCMFVCCLYVSLFLLVCCQLCIFVYLFVSLSILYLSVCDLFGQKFYSLLQRGTKLVPADFIMDDQYGITTTIFGWPKRRIAPNRSIN